MIRKGPTSCALKSIRVSVACDNSYDSIDHSTQKKSSAQNRSSARTQIRGVFRAKMVRETSQRCGYLEYYCIFGEIHFID